MSNSTLPPFPGAAPGEPIERLIRLPDVLAVVGVGRTQWLDLVKAGQAPAPIKIGRASAWASTEVQAFIRGRIARRG